MITGMRPPDIFPAHTGVSPCYGLRNNDFIYFPRTYGGEPGEVTATDAVNLFSPHIRG